MRDARCRRRVTVFHARRVAPSCAMVHAATFSPVVYQLRVMLEYIDLPIWRRLHVPGRFTLTQLHDVIQPEDCGGVPGYDHLLEAAADPDHDEFTDRFGHLLR